MASARTRHPASIWLASNRRPVSRRATLSFSRPSGKASNSFWSLGPASVAQTLVDFGARQSAVDQARAQFVLQRLEAAAERRLRQVRALGGARERALFSQCGQVGKLAQVHIYDIKSFIR